MHDERRMTDEQIAELNRRGESERLERKRQIRGEALGETVCAFANDLSNSGQPGVLIVGMDDDGGCAATAITDELLLTLASVRQNGQVQPMPSMAVRKALIDGCEVAVVVVERSTRPPVRYKGRTWIRVGPSNAHASREDELRLAERARAADVAFDARPAFGAKLDDFDLVRFQREYLPRAVSADVLEENERTVEEQLCSLRLATPDGDPTYLGVLTLADQPQQFIAGAYVQFLRIDGTELGDPILDRKEIDGPLPELLPRLSETLEINISTALDVSSGPVEIARPDYPIDALRQLAYNAVLHRAYEGTNAPIRVTWFRDRIEIYNPGGPFGQVTPDNFGHGATDYRNPGVAEAMKVLGFVQKFGVGIQIARRSLQENGNPKLAYELEETGVLAVVRRPS